MFVYKLFCLFVALFYNVWHCIALIHTNEFAVHISGPATLANHIAAKYGFMNKGQIGSLQGYYLFVHDGIQKRSVDPSKYHKSLLMNDSMVSWCDQQIVKKRVKRANIVAEFRDFTDPLYPDQWFLKADYNDYDMNVRPAWKKGYTGKGVVVSILDDGIQGNHPDLAINYDKEASLDINDDDDDPSPKDDDDNKHGTRCAGEVAAVANNEFCGVGVAFNARIGGVRMLDGRVTDSIEATALSLKPNHIHIYSASWGPEDDGKTVDGPGPLAKIAFEEGIQKGRNGLGSIYVWASGNGGKQNDNCNCDGYTNSIYTISISSATESGYKPWYLEECSSTLATTYSSGTTSTDRNIVTVDVNYGYFEELKRGESPHPSMLCTKKHTGTSASAPIAAGLCALALEANPKLTWRDIQYIIVLTSRYIPLINEDGWITNGANRKVSTKFGYGLMDGDAMVSVAANWKSLIDQHICVTSPDENVRTIPKRKGDHVEAVIRTDACENTRNFVRYAEHIQVRVSLSFHPRGNLHIMLVSPKNTTSSLLFPRPHDTDMSQNSFNDWPFMSVHFWGEEIAGSWKLIVHNAGTSSSEYSGSLTNWSITFYGTEDLPACVKYHNCENVKNLRELHIEHSYPIRGVSDSPYLSAEQCKESNKFLFISDGVPKHCVSKCPSGFYGNRKDYLCHRCDESCYSCYGPSYNNCLTCQSSSFLYNSTCVKHCSEGYLPGPLSISTSNTEKFQQCIPCAHTCTLCEENMYKCSLCTEGFYLFNHQCLPYCPHETYAADGKCMPCSSKCQLCYGPYPYNCLTCPTGYYLMNNKCVSHCPENYFADDEDSCISCHRSCDSCTSQIHCLTCDKGKKYHKKKMEGICEFNMCGPFSLDYPEDCISCKNSQCRVCLLPDYCDLCKKGLHWYMGDCFDKCPDATYEFLDECKDCAENCLGCAESPYKCTGCKPGFFLYDNHCVTNCPVGFYGSTQNNMCEKCHSSCKECFGPSNLHCMSCPLGNLLLNNSCVGFCPFGYFSTFYTIKDLKVTGASNAQLNGDKVRVCLQCHPTCKTCTEYGPFHCTSCPSGRLFLDNTCIPCLDGDFYNSHDRECQKCDDQCGTCFGPYENHCLSCLAPLRLHNRRHVCLPCCISKSDAIIEDCCTCSDDLDFCVINDPDLSNLTYTTVSQYSFSQQITTLAISVSAAAIIVFIILFVVLQCRSSGFWHRGFRGQRYTPVPRELNASYNCEQEKVCLTQEDAEEEDELYVKT